MSVAHHMHGCYYKTSDGDTIGARENAPKLVSDAQSPPRSRSLFCCISPSSCTFTSTALTFLYSHAHQPTILTLPYSPIRRPVLHR